MTEALLVEWRDVRVGAVVRDDDGASHEVFDVRRSEPLADGKPGQMRVTLDGETRSVWPTSQVWVEVSGG